MFILFDLEFTSWEGSLSRNWSGTNEFREIVQIGACKVNELESLHQTSLFNMFVKPKINSRLSNYFSDLTGITQEEVDRSDYLDNVLPEFLDFVGDCPLYSWGDDVSVIIENLHLYNMNQSLNVSHYDIRTIFKKFDVCSDTVDSSGQAYKLSNHPSILIPGSPHNALSDSLSLLIGLAKLGQIHGFENVYEAMDLML